MKSVLRLTLIFLIGSPCLGAVQENAKVATSDSLKLLYFTATWCGPCQMMKQKTWPSPLVQKALQKFDFQTIDVDAQPKVARHWSVRSMPTYIIADPDGKTELARLSGFMDSQRMAVWLRNVNAKARQSLESILKARKAAEQNWATLAPLAQANPPAEVLQRGQQALYTLLQQRGDLPIKTAEDLDALLHGIAGKHPQYLAKGLLHEDLQVRVYIARALAPQETSIDPWANEEARKKAYIHIIQNQK